jgi:hypothetical protein
MRAMLLAAVCAVCLFAGSEVQAMGAETQSNQYTKWRYGPPADPSFFPIGVWAQAPRDAGKYREIGVNFLLSLPGGPTEEQLADLRKHGMRTICRQNEVGLAHGDEPDNFRRSDAGQWVPKATPQKIIDDYEQIVRKDPGRPVLLNLGQGVANDQWKGGWAKADDYVELVKGSDIVSYDIYPMCSSRSEAVIPAGCISHPHHDQAARTRPDAEARLPLSRTRPRRRRAILPGVQRGTEGASQATPDPSTRCRLRPRGWRRPIGRSRSTCRMFSARTARSHFPTAIVRP